LLGGLAVLLVYVALVVLLLWAPKVRKRSLRLTSRIFGAAGIVLLALALLAVLLPFALIMGAPPTESRVAESSDGQQAKLSYDAGFLGRDSTEVTLKHTGCCRHTQVFWHFGPSEFSDPKLEWIDNRHLRITYHTSPDDLQHCENQVRDIAIICTSKPWPDSPLPVPTKP
jgi:hypothetical protein